MALPPAERNKLIVDSLTQYIERVKAGDGPAPDRYPSERNVLERLIPISTDGFRGVTLTAIMGKMVRADTNTATEFDSINPRGIFEKAIRPVLKQYRIPTSASAPLNVAKNVQVLDEKWAEGRKPEDAAMAAVDYIRRVNRHWSDPTFRDDLIMMFLQRLLAYASEVASHDVEMAATDGILPITLARRLAAFSIEFPEGGAIPQFVVGSILTEIRANDTQFLPLGGSEASVFGTNSTSNKPSDLWETLKTGEFNNLYEVTCKPVDEERLSAAVDSFAKLGLTTPIITFVCRMPSDSASLKLVDNAIVHKGLPFQFIDITSFIETNFIMLTSLKRASAIDRIAHFVRDPSRAVKTKKGWGKAFGESAHE